MIMPRVPPPCFKKRQFRPRLGRHIRLYASRGGCRTYVHTPGRILLSVLIFFFRYALMSVFVCMYKEGESTARHSSKNNENETEKSERKTYHRLLSSKNFMPDWNTLHPVKKKIEKYRTEELLSQPRSPPAPLATTSLPIRSW